MSATEARALYEQIRSFISVGQRALQGWRTESRNGNWEDWDALVEKLNQRPLASIPHVDLRSAATYAQAIRAELYDRRGEYEKMHHCLTFASEVSSMVSQMPRSPQSNEEWNSVLAVIWYRLVHSISLHRQGNLAQATEMCESALEWVADLRQQVRAGRTRFPRRIPRRLIFLEIRLRYAYGRHIQSAGHAKKAEAIFGGSFALISDYVARISKPTNAYMWKHKGTLPTMGARTKVDEIQNMRHLTSRHMVARARASLDQGQLSRAQRQLYIARLAIQDTISHLEVGFIDYLLARTKRQLGELGSAIELLRQCRDVFQHAGHERYLRRCCQELAKALINQEDYEEAEKVIAEADESKASYTVDEKSIRRFEAQQLLLKARIDFQRQQNDQAAKNLHQAIRLLESAGHSEDLLAQAYAVLADLKLGEFTFSESIDYAERALLLEPEDVTDRAWAYLILAEAHLKRRRPEISAEYFEKLKALGDNLENQRMAMRREQLRMALDSERSNFFINSEEVKLGYAALEQRLRAFMINMARIDMKNQRQEALAARLGISRQTYSNWLSELKSKGLVDD